MNHKNMKLDLEGAEKTIKQADSLLDTLKSFIRKHWGILLAILFCAFIYWAWNLPEIEDEPHAIEQPYDGETE